MDKTYTTAGHLTPTSAATSATAAAISPGV
jgi:hypothetical protein